MRKGKQSKTTHWNKYAPAINQEEITKKIKSKKSKEEKRKTKPVKMTMWQSGGMGHSTQNNPWMKLMGIVAKERRHDNTQSQTGSNERALNM